MSFRDRLLDDDPFYRPDTSALEAQEQAERRKQREQAEADRRDQLLADRAAQIDRLRTQAVLRRTPPPAPRTRTSLWVWPFRRPGGYSSTRAAGVLYLAAAVPSLGVRGALIGKELLSGTGVAVDGFTQYGEDLPSADMIALGLKGSGKSATIKCYALRQMTFRRQVAAIDSKTQKGGRGEWATMALALGYTPLSFGGVGGIRLNLLDPRIAPVTVEGRRGQVGQDAILRAVGEVATERRMTSTERRALRAAHGYVRAVCDPLNKTLSPAGCPFGKGDEPTLPMVAWALLNPNPAAVQEARLGVEQAVEIGRPIADGFDELCSGDLAGLVDGPTTPGLDLDQQLLVFDLSAIDADSPALPVLMSLIGVFLQAAWVRPDDKIKRILVIEEGWHIIGHLGTAKLLRRLTKFSRALGLQVITILHRLSDLNTGDEELSSIIAALLKEASIRLIFAQHWNERQQVAETFGLPDFYADDLDKMGRGHAVLQVGQHLFRLMVPRTRLEQELTNTDDAATDEDDDEAA